MGVCASFGRDGLQLASDKLSEQTHLFEVALHHMNQGLCMFDAQSRLLVCNHRYHEIFGLPYDRSLFGKTQEEICALLIARGCYLPSVTLEQIREGRQTALRHDRGSPVLRELADGRTLSVLYRVTEGGGWVSTFEDITEQRRSHERIRHLAQYDGLTDLANARTLRARGRALAVAASWPGAILACHYLDLDRFKFVNDTYGHGVGDELLGIVAERLRACCRREDVVGRLGGDEFAVIQCTPDETAALVFAHRLMSEIALPFDLSTGRIEIGVSIGLATRVGRCDDIEPLLQEADLAARQAKSTERGTVCRYERTMSEMARERRVMERELHAALGAEQLVVHYQPLVAASGRIVGAEALTRWPHPQLGLVPPSTFIPLAEEIGLIARLGTWVLRRACCDALEWPDPLSVAVNVSSLQMRQKAFADLVLTILAETALPPHRLEIEITESALLAEDSVTMRNLYHLKQAGVRFALDDFGTGYSSLSYLRRFQFDKIKIDRSFLRDAETHSDARAIIRAVTSLGDSLGITTLVEGVETEQQLSLARAEGLQQFQGYLFGKPQSQEAMLRTISSQNAEGSPR